MTDSWTDDEVAPAPLGLPPVQPVNVHNPEVQRDIERRERLRTEEMEHLTRLRDRVQQGMDEGLTDLESGTAMLLNISKARMALAGVGFYPAF